MMKLSERLVYAVISAGIGSGLYFWSDNSQWLFWQKIASNALLVFYALLSLNGVLCAVGLPIAEVSTKTHRGPTGAFLVKTTTMKSTAPSKYLSLLKILFLILTFVALANIALSICIFTTETIRIELIIHSVLFGCFALLSLVSKA